MVRIRNAYSCVILNCENHKSIMKKKPEISYFQFPLEKYQPELRKIWLRNIRYQEWEPSEIQTICSLHFAPECFRITMEKKAYLKENACPTIFNHEGPSLQRVKMEQKLYYTAQEIKRKCKKKKSGVKLVKTTFNLKTDQLPKFLEKDCCVPLKKCEVFPSKFHQSFVGFLCGLEVPPMSLLPGVPRKLVGNKPMSAPKRPVNTASQVQPLRGLTTQRRNGNDNVMSLNRTKFIVNNDHCYKYPTIEELILRNNSHVMNMKKQQEEIEKSKKVRADMRLTIKRLKRKVERLENQVKKYEANTIKKNKVESKIQRVLSKQQMPIPSNVLNSISIPKNIPERPPWMPHVAPLKPYSRSKMISRKCQTRKRDFMAKVNGDINLSDDEMIELNEEEMKNSREKLSKEEKMQLKWKRGFEAWEKKKIWKRADERNKKLEQSRKESHERYLKFHQNHSRKVTFNEEESKQVPKSSDIEIDLKCEDAGSNSEMENMAAKLVTTSDGSVYAILDEEVVNSNTVDVTESTSVEEMDKIPEKHEKRQGEHQQDNIDNMEETFKIEEALKHIMSPVKGEQPL